MGANICAPCAKGSLFFITLFNKKRTTITKKQNMNKKEFKKKRGTKVRAYV